MTEKAAKPLGEMETWFLGKGRMQGIRNRQDERAGGSIMGAAGSIPNTEVV